MLKIIVFIIFAVILPTLAFAGGTAKINILYTGAIRGELEPCGCSPKSNSGGLARLSAYIAANKAALTPYILIDAGHSMGDDTPQGRLKSDVVIAAFKKIGYDVVAFFDDDNISLLEGSLKSLVYTSVVLHEGSDFQSDVVLKRGPAVVNITTDTKGQKPERINVLLTDMTLSEAKLLKGWNVIILSSGEKFEKPLRTNGTTIISGYQKGEKLGILSLDLTGNGTVTGSTHRWQTLGKDLSEDAMIRSLIDEYDIKVAGLLKDAQRQAPSEKTYYGVESCIECHEPFFEQWSTTRHSGAYGSLEAVGKSKDPECVTCHTTGYTEAGGFFSAGTTPELKNVQCEQCHGPGRSHLADWSVPIATIEESVCLRCHTEDNSPDFDFTTYREKIKH